MLGIRYINNTAVDLWVGKASEFEADKKYSYEHDSGSLEEVLKSSDQEKIRHLGIIFNDPNQETATKLFEDLKSFCGWFPERITIILKSLTEYNLVQKVMFSILLKRS